MREAIISTLAQALSNNIDQRLTHELASGIATAVNQAALAAEHEATKPGEDAPHAGAPA